MLIGLSGYKQSGKDTCAAYLGSRGWHQESFAGRLKEIVSEIFNIEKSVFEDGKLKEVVDPRYNKTPRELLIAVGSTCIRGLYEQAWSDLVLHRYLKDPKPTVISDVRFQNEAGSIIENGGIIFRIIRPGYEKGEDVGDIDWSATPHVRIVNDSTKKGLFAVIDLTMEEQL